MQKLAKNQANPKKSPRDYRLIVDGKVVGKHEDVTDDI